MTSAAVCPGDDAIGPVNIAASAGAIALVHAGREGSSRAGEHDRANVFILFYFVQGFVHFFDHAAADRVHRLRTVQRDQSAAALLS